MTKRRSRGKRARKLDAFNDQEGLCYLCGYSMTMTPFRPHSATWDHIVAKANGGSNDPWNKKLACRDCNNAKADLPIKVYHQIKNSIQGS